MAIKDDFITEVQAAYTAFFTNQSNWPGGLTQAQVIDRIARGANYQENIPDGDGGTVPNPQSKADFLLDKQFKQLADFFKAGDAAIEKDTLPTPRQID